MANLFAKDVAAGAANGADWANAFGPAELDNWATNLSLPDEYCYCLTGTYTMPTVTTARNGSPATPIWVIGVANEVAAPGFPDWASGNARPLFEFAGSYLQVNTRWRMHNLRITGTSTTLARGGAATVWENCKVESASALAASQALRLSGYGAQAVNCELANPNGRALHAEKYSAIVDCLIRNCNVGILAVSDGLHIISNLIRDCDVGIDLAATLYHAVVNNTLYNGTIGISGTDDTRGTFINNIFSGFVTPASWTANFPASLWDHDVWHNSPTPLNVTKGPHAINEDPGFVDPAAGDFRLRERVFGLSPPGAVGGVLVGAIQSTPPGAPPAAPSYSADQLVLDGLETVYLDDHEIKNSYRLEEEVEEQDESQGVYQARNVDFHLPCGAAIYLPGGNPRIGGLVRDVDHVEYRILAVRQPHLDDFWGVTTRSLAISGEYNLDHLITLWPYKDSTDAYGSKVTTFPAADSAFTDVPCRIQEQPEQLKEYTGKRAFVQQFDIFLERDITVRAGDRLIDQDGTLYSIRSSRSRTSISQYSVIEAIIK